MLRKMAEDPSTYPYEPPEIRRRVILEDYDFDRVVRHEFVLHRSNRIDCYRVVIDGHELPQRLGWAKVMEMARKAFVRVRDVY